MKNLITLINNTQADLLFSIANETISALNDNAENNDRRHPFVLANLECALEDLRSAESDWNSTFHPLDMDEEDRHVHGDYLGDLEREGEKR
jgi:hypothetical protein